MTVSGILGFTFFIVANFTRFFQGSDLIAGILQLAVNAFVFATWLKGYLDSSGLKKFIAFFGVVVPFVMATITIWRVLLPSLLR